MTPSISNSKLEYVPYVSEIKKDINSTEIDGPLLEILQTSNQDFLENGIPLNLIEAWKDRFYSSLYSESNMIRQLCNIDASWAVDLGFFIGGPRSTIFSSTNDSITPQEYFMLRFKRMCYQYFWNDTPKLIITLVHLYKLKKSIASQDALFDEILRKFMNCVTEKIVQASPEFQNKELFSIGLPNSEDHEVAKHKRLCFFKTTAGWIAGDFDAFPKSSIRIATFNLNNTKILILDTNEKIVERPTTIINASLKPISAGARQDLVKVDIVTYSGSERLRSNNRNAVTFTFIIDKNNLDSGMLMFKQDAPFITDLTEIVTGQNLKYIKSETERVLEAFGKDFISVKNYSEPCIFELLHPETKVDKLLVLAFIFRELKKNPKENASLIQYAATMLGCNFSEEELEKLETSGQATVGKDGYDISIEAVVDKLESDTKAEMTLLLNDSTPKSTAQPSLEHKDEPAAAEIKHPDKAVEAIKLEKVLKKAQRKAAFEAEQRKVQAQAAQVDTSSTSGQMTSIFDKREQAEIDSIYKGAPMKGQKFATFAMGLMRKKAAALGATVEGNRVGSHPKLHFKRKDGTSGGVTFHVPHGRDSHGNLSSQKDTLERIFSL